MRPPDAVRGLTLDAGALIGIERRSARVAALLLEAAARHWPIGVPVGVLAQVWRGSPRQALLARFLGRSEVTIAPMDERSGFLVGVLCGQSGQPDVVDAAVIVCARLHRHAVVQQPRGSGRGRRDGAPDRAVAGTRPGRLARRRHHHAEGAVDSLAVQ